ncbi:MAG: transcription antitermination factor NusB [Myxococcota bacterium]
MQARRASREHALQMLYQLEQQQLRQTHQDGSGRQGVFEQVSSLAQVDEGALEGFAAGFFKRFCPQGVTDAYALRLVRGVAAHLPQIDETLAGISHGWKLARMAVVDRNILRIAAYELLFESSLPPAVVMNEAVEVARRYGAQQSPAFVNGVLDALAHKPRSV